MIVDCEQTKHFLKAGDSLYFPAVRIIATFILVVAVILLSGPAEAEEKSADEVARELANPNNSLASLTFKNQYRWYTGDLPGADNQDNFTILFQPVFPFAMEPTSSGMTLLPRNGISASISRRWCRTSLRSGWG